MFANGLCTRPFELECRTEFADETCAYLHTRPSPCPYSANATANAIANATAPGDHDQPHRSALFDGLLERIASNRA